MPKNARWSARACEDESRGFSSASTNLICDLALIRRERRRLVRPVQASANVRVDQRTRAGQLVGELMQLAHLLEERLELRVVDRHDPSDGTWLA